MLFLPVIAASVRWYRPMIGKVVSHYRITEKLGSGSMGSVFRAEHTRVSLTVAIKFIGEHLVADPRAKERFLREAEAVASIEHPNVCRFYEVGETAEGRLYIVMSYMDGGTLSERLANGPLFIPDAVEIAAAVADGLAYAHRKKIVHRDIKPANITFTSDGGVKIVDFGLAMLVDRTQLSREGTTVGTFLYMSPEQAGSSRVDGRSDLFALGDVLYEMVAGAPPFKAEEPSSVVYRLRAEPHRPVRELRPDVPESLAGVIDRALQKNPDDRYPCADEMRDALLGVLAEIAPERLRPRVASPPHRARARRRAVTVASVLIPLLALLIWQRDTVVSRLGLGGEAISIAIVPVADDAGEHAALVAGMAHDFTDRIRQLSGETPAVWIVPQSRLRLSRAKRADEAPGLVGARRVLTVQAVPLSASTVALERLDIASSPVSHGSLQLSFEAGALAMADVDRTIAQLAGVKARSPSLSGYTGNPDAYHAYLVGLGHMSAPTPRLSAADSALSVAVARDSSFARAWAGLGETYRLRFETARDSLLAHGVRRACERALAIDGELAGAHITMGRLHASQGHVTDAIAAFEAALQLSPRHPDALRELGISYETAGRAGDAEAIYRRAVKLHPRDLDAHEMLGYFYYTHDRYLDAISEFRANATLAANYGQTYNYLGACYFAVDCWDQALAAFERSFELHRSYVACSNLGTLYYFSQRFDDAARMYEWTIEYGRNWQTLSFLASASYWIERQRERALTLFAEARALAEEQRSQHGADASLLAELAGLYAMEHSDSAEVLAERAAKLAPESPTVLYRVATTLEIVGRREKALVFLGRAINSGHSVRQIESEQFLAELRKDLRYEFLMRSVGPPAADCSRMQ